MYAPHAIANQDQHPGTVPKHWMIPLPTLCPNAHGMLLYFKNIPDAVKHGHDPEQCKEQSPDW